MVDSDEECIHKGSPFVYIMKSKCAGIGPWGTPCFIVPQPEKKFWASFSGT
jgi:hypothetical protein